MKGSRHTLTPVFIMKKFLVPVVAFATFLLVACSSATPGEEANKMVEEATEKVENAKDVAELEALGDEFETKFAELKKANKDYQPTAEEEKKMEEAMKKFQEACQKKAKELVDDMLGGSGENEE